MFAPCALDLTPEAETETETSFEVFRAFSALAWQRLMLLRTDHTTTNETNDYAQRDEPILKSW